MIYRFYYWVNKLILIPNIQIVQISIVGILPPQICLILATGVYCHLLSLFSKHFLTFFIGFVNAHHFFK